MMGSFFSRTAYSNGDVNMKNPGRPVIPQARRRVQMNTTLAPATLEFLNDQPESIGKTIDWLVERYIKDLIKT